ncbi:hypothetical protein Dsin_022473 [Dipteronia sinensis]|uniref:Uncharacterized protein n=1 Tax=Dipteronia sinensis TaxID=43782 RepID=A0AAE0DZU1_9ROSI|nr:hypothetical protein Dsin_022473 [Dipteronia sinensis]
MSYQTRMKAMQGCLECSQSARSGRALPSALASNLAAALQSCRSPTGVLRVRTFLIIKLSNFVVVVAADLALEADAVVAANVAVIAEAVVAVDVVVVAVGDVVVCVVAVGVGVAEVADAADAAVVVFIKVLISDPRSLSCALPCTILVPYINTSLHQNFIKL